MNAKTTEEIAQTNIENKEEYKSLVITKVKELLATEKQSTKTLTEPLTNKWKTNKNPKKHAKDKIKNNHPYTYKFLETKSITKITILQQ